MEFAHDKNRAEIERGEEEIRFVGYSITKKKGELPQITIHSA
jgi:hypothetical protein